MLLNKLFKNRKTSQKGFTLIEVIVAACILVCASIPLMMSFAASSKVNVMGRQKEQAQTIAENVVEGVKAVGANNSYKWSALGVTAYSVVPDGSYVSKSGKVYYENVPVDLSNYKTANGVLLKDAKDDSGSNVFKEEDLKNKKLSVASYIIKIDDVVMGSTKYDAFVVVRRNAEDIDSLAAYAFQDYFTTAGINLMEYYDVTAYVGTDFSKIELPSGDQTKSETMDDFLKKMDDECLAKYTGTDISQTQV